MRRLLSLLPLVCFPMAAQVTTGSVQGTVRDLTGAVVPGVNVELVNVDTNFVYRAQTNESGVYIFNLVSPGKHRVRASLANFQTSEVSGVVVETGSNTIIDVTIQPGTVTQKIEVNAAAENVDTQSSAGARERGLRHDRFAASEYQEPAGRGPVGARRGHVRINR